MISVKIASIIATAAFAAGAFFSSPVPAAIAAVIATDVQCTGCVGTPDLAGNAVTSPKIKDGEVKTMDIGDSQVKTADLGAAAVTNAKIADSAVNSAKIADGAIGYADVSRSLIAVEHRNDCNCGGTGWDPDGTAVFESIHDDRITTNSVVVVAVTSVGNAPICSTLAASLDGRVFVLCTDSIPNGTGINYAIFNNPAYP